jgi:hypothetical protein
MSGEGDDMIFHIRRGRHNQIRSQDRKIESDSMSGEEHKMSFDVRRRR